MYCSRVHNQTLHPPVHAACRRSDVGLHTHQQTLRSIIKLATRQCMPREVTVTYGNRILRHHELLELALSPKYTFHFYNDSDTRAFVAEQCPDYLDAYDCVLPGGNKTHKLNLSFRSMRASASFVTTPLLINAFSTFVSYAHVKQVVTHPTLHAPNVFCLFICSACFSPPPISPQLSNRTFFGTACCSCVGGCTWTTTLRCWCAPKNSTMRAAQAYISCQR
jgi:hypothetical protein